jgi:hypothetical protein
MEEKIYIGKRIIDEKKFFVECWGSECHGKPSFLLWINRKLVKIAGDKEYIILPCKDAKIIKTEKGNLVLRPCVGWHVFKVGVECGYRGESWFEILDPTDCEIFEYKVFHSPLGSLGISRYGLVNSPSPKIKVKWTRSGRLYGAPSEGITIYYNDGRTEEIAGIQDGLESLKELEELTQE